MEHCERCREKNHKCFANAKSGANSHVRCIPCEHANQTCLVRGESHRSLEYSPASHPRRARKLRSGRRKGEALFRTSPSIILYFFQAFPQVETWDHVSPGPRAPETGKLNEFKGRKFSSGATKGTPSLLPLGEKRKPVKGNLASQVFIQKLYKHAKAIVDEVEEAGLLDSL